MRSPQIDQAFLTVEASSRGNHTNLALIRTAYEVLVITGGGKWVEIKTHTDPLYQHLIVTAE
jgi:hypothetical protein